MLREPLALLAERCMPVWGDRGGLNTVLLDGLSSIPYCTCLYVLDEGATQISDNINKTGIQPGNFQRDRSECPYMKEAMPAWGFLLSDAYVSLKESRGQST